VFDIFRKIPLKWKLTSLLLSLNFILVFSLYISYTQIEKKLLREVEEQIKELTTVIQIGVKEITGGDPNILNEYLNSLKTRGIKEISIISNTQEIIASTNPQKIGKPISHKKKELIIKAELGEQVSEEKDEKEDVYNVIVPIVAGNVQYGYMHLKINKENFSQILKINALKRMLITLFILSIGTVLIYIISARYTKPINVLAEAAIKVAQGNFSYRLDINKKDEFGKIAESFNFMMQKLEENQLLQKRLREAEHLSTLNYLSRSIAHEIRNPLNFINLSIDHLIERLKKEEMDFQNYVKLLENMKQEIFRIDKLIREYLDYIRPLKLDIKSVDIKEIMDEVVANVEIAAKKQGVNIYKDYESFIVNIDAGLIKSCLLNIIVNSLQAMKDSVIKNLYLKTEKAENKFLVISISDTGCGVPKELLDKIFEPYFTTKKEGLGLGLSLTKKVIEEHGGKIKFLSEYGKGSEVKIYLPL